MGADAKPGGAAAVCPAIAAIEGIVGACDPKNCDAGHNRRYLPAECYENWAGRTEDSQPGKPGLDYATWKYHKEHATSPIQYGRFLRVLNSASFFVAHCFEKARGSTIKNELKDLNARLAKAQIEVVDPNGSVRKKPALDFITFTENNAELKKEAILGLSRHPGIGNKGVGILIVDIPGETPLGGSSIVSRLLVLFGKLKRARKIQEIRKGCVQIFISEDAEDQASGVFGQIPQTLAEGGTLVYIDQEEFWEITVATGIDELVPGTPTTCRSDQPEALAAFTDSALTRITRRQALRARYGVGADILGRIVGSFRRLLQALRANARLNLLEREMSYPGWDRNQFNAANTGSGLLRSTLFRDTFLLWPAFGTLVALLLVPALWVAHFDLYWTFVAFGGAFFLAAVGSRPCAAAVSYAGTGLGGWAFACLFALSQSCVFSRGLMAPDSNRFVDLIVGGLVGSRAKAFYGDSPALFITALLLSSCAIAFSAWAMRGPLKAAGGRGAGRGFWEFAHEFCAYLRDCLPSQCEPAIAYVRQRLPEGGYRGTDFFGGLCAFLIGTLPGVLVPVVLFAPQLFGDGVFAVAGVCGLVSGVAFACCALMSITGRHRWLRESLLHCALVTMLVLAAGIFTNPTVKVMFGCAATGILHGSIFTLVFVLTRCISQSAKLAAFAAAIEGVAGFIGFALSKAH